MSKPPRSSEELFEHCQLGTHIFDNIKDNIIDCCSDLHQFFSQTSGDFYNIWKSVFFWLTYWNLNINFAVITEIFTIKWYKFGNHKQFVNISIHWWEWIRITFFNLRLFFSGGRVQGWESVCCGVLAILLLENKNTFNVSKWKTFLAPREHPG